MAPEQLEGRDADARTDIFAFGAVVYEMVTGKKAFEGKSQASLIGAIMTSQPPPIAALQPMTPPALDHIVRTCLAKDPDERWQTAGDIERQLKFIVDGRSQVGAVVPAPAPARRRHVRTLVAAAAGCAVGAIAAALVLWGWARGAAIAPEPQRVSVVVPSTQPLAFSWQPGSSLAISPDGKQLAYVGTDLAAPPGPGRDRLYVRSLDGLAVRELSGTANARQPFFSPDGRWLAFFTTTGELRKVALAGGSPLTLLEKLNGSMWGFGTWTDDDVIVFGAPGGGGLWRIPADGGSAQPLTMIDASQGESSHWQPELVAGTRAVLFWVNFTALRDQRVDAVMLDSGERRVLVENAYGPHYLSSGHLLFQRDEAILVAPFDPARLVLTGPAVPLLDEIRRDAPASQGNVAQLAVSRSGTLAYVPAVNTASALGAVSRDGTFEPLGAPPARFDRVQASPDGRYVALTVGRVQQQEVHVHDVMRGTTSRLTRQGSDEAAAWHPNNQALAVFSRTQDARGLFLKDLNGGERLLVPAEGSTQLRDASWSPDGRLLTYTVQTGNEHDIWVLTMGDKPIAQPLVSSPAREHSPRFSPNGAWLAYVSDESGREEVHVRRYPQGERFQVSTAGGVGPVWNPNGREIFFQGPHEGSQKLMVVSVTADGDSLRLGAPMPLFDMRVRGSTGVMEQYATTSNGGRRYDIFPDGKRFVMIRQPDSQEAREVVLVQNWLAELARLAPVR
jgi:serine/threonine-protein kinase